MKLRKTCYIFGQIGVAKKRKYIWPFLPNVLFDPLYRHIPLSLPARLPFSSPVHHSLQWLLRQSHCGFRSMLKQSSVSVFFENIESSVYFSIFQNLLLKFNHIIRYLNLSFILSNLFCIISSFCCIGYTLIPASSFSAKHSPASIPPPPGAEAKLQSHIHQPF